METTVEFDLLVLNERKKHELENLYEVWWFGQDICIKEMTRQRYQVELLRHIVDLLYLIIKILLQKGKK